MPDSPTPNPTDDPEREDGSPDWTSYSDVLDNETFTVSDRVNALAPRANTLDIAVGYFYLGGFDLVKDNIKDTEEVRLIIGTHTSSQTVKELKRGFSENLNEFDKEDAEPGVKRLYEFIQLGQVDVRIYNKARFHPKLYLFKNSPNDVDLGRAIIGSSNMSASGLQGNVELNVEKKDNATIRYLENWYDELWAAADEFDTDLMADRIEDSQFGDAVSGGGDTPPTPPVVEGPPVADVNTISPYEATKRFIVEQFRYEVDDGTFLEDIRGEYEEQLTAFQDDAFRAARRPLDKYNGVILADSVGLGKSYIGAPLVKEYTTSLDEVLVIAPNRLKSMWMNDLLDEDDGEFPTRADKTFLSFAGLSRLSEQDIQRLQNVDLVLIDEAHNLRNTGTQRYAKLQSIGRRGKKFVMLTATPIQNSVRDVENVVKVFADDDDFDIELHGRTPSDAFREYDNLSSRDDLSTHEQSQLDELEQDIESILREVVISRDRRYILDEYEEITIGGEPIKVPDRIPRLVTPDDPRLDDLYAEIIETILGPEDADTGGLNIPYVSADRYDADGDEEEELIVEYQNASVLMLINLLKRLESSFAAFEDSIDRLIQRERVTRQIARGELSDSKTREQAVEQIRATFTDDFAKDIDFDDVTEAIGRVSGDKRQEIIEDIDQDLIALKDLRDKAQSVLQTESDDGLRDAKVMRLQSILDRELESEKVLVFSQYVPTVYHIFKQLTGEDPDSTQIAAVDGRGGDRTVAYVHGGKHFDESLVKRFAPRAQDADVTPDEEIDILITTDVLGVGQNLQDSRVLVNYDLHWNPMKMEQRIGRIDRITTRHDELLIYNFVPTGNLKEQLGLMDRIQKKIRDIARTFGHAAPILDTAEEQVHKTMMTYERLDEDGANFGDDRLEGIGSKYDDLRSTARAFCEEHGIEIGELEETLEAVEGREEPQYFVLPEQTDTGFVTLVSLVYDSGRKEWQTTIFDEDNLQRDEVAGQMIFANFPRRTTDEIEIFNIIASADPTRYSIPEDVFGVVSSFTEDISSTSTWQNDILQRDAGESRTITRVKRLCQSVLDAEMDLGVEDEAEEIIEMISDREMSDWAEQQIETIHRRRRRYGRVGTIERLHHKLTAEIELVEPEQITDVDVALTGKMAPTITQQEGTDESDE
ncbi:helicase-related protein [Haloarcula sp. NS06]|uniref:helicase-related protein n=1 Tax=Haloarcula sp. NS06 TaxID=3409688 RepID=UPI003DA6E52C